jgi:type IV pilus assembly protein PilV
MQTTAFPQQQQGSALLEALIGILIFSMGILAIVGLQAASIGFTADAKYRTDASFYADQAIGKMWGDSYLNWPNHRKTEPIIGLPNGTRTVTVDPITNGHDAQALVTVTITWQPPNSATPHSFVTAAQVTQYVP